MFVVALTGCGRATFQPVDAGGAPAPDADTRAAPDAGVDAEVDVEVDEASAPETCEAICNAARPRDPVVSPDGGAGNVTMYTTEPSRGGACNYGETAVSYFVAVNVNVAPGDGKGQWQGGRICGQCAEVTALTSRGAKSVVVRVMDKCPDGACGMDLGGLAPAAIMSDGFGRYDGRWRFVSCVGHPEVFDGEASLFVFGGANAYWSRVHVRNGPSSVSAIDWQAEDGTRGTFAYARDPENAFEVPLAVLQSSQPRVAVTVRFSDGSVEAVELSPGDFSRGGTSYPLK